MTFTKFHNSNQELTSVQPVMASLDQQQDLSWKLRWNHENWGVYHSPFHKIDLALHHALNNSTKFPKEKAQRLLSKHENPNSVNRPSSYS